MGDFAIVAEGYTDQLVIKSVILGFYGDHDDEPLVTFEQPRLDETARHGAAEPGGWSLVLTYFDRKEHLQALQLNRYLVVHIDTDVSEQYGVAKRPADEVEAMIADVVAIFRARIGEEVWAAHGDRFIFAVAVHSIECWLLPALLPEHKPGARAKIAGCFDAADGALRERGGPRLVRIGSQGKGKDPDGYRAALRPYLRRRELMRLKDDNPSLRVFVQRLDGREFGPPEPPSTPPSDGSTTQPVP